MKAYIEFNTERIKGATNEADKNFKLLNNAVYGKTMENMRKIIKIRITTNEKDFLKYSSRAAYISHISHEKKEIVKLSKPIYAGCTVLELSKLAMYEFYHDFLKQKCENSKMFIHGY